ncbi:hypothetical protein ABT364_01155 [Massilia sp. SR12]
MCALMRFALLGCLFLPLLANAVVLSGGRVQSFPSAWPALKGMSANCAEIQGSYIDPNQRRWDYEEFRESQLGVKSGGHYHGVWWALGLPHQEVQPEVRHALPRTFAVVLTADQGVTINYRIGEKLISSRTFGKGEWSCDADGLTLTVLDRKGQGMDIIPYHGHFVRRATLYRVNEFIYLRAEDRSKTWLAHVIPKSSLNVEWVRFVGERERPTATLAAGDVLRMNTARQVFLEKYLPGKGSKAFAQAPDGSWGWAVDRTSPRVAAEDAVAACSKHVKPHNKPCAVVHIDDWWAVPQ